MISLHLPDIKTATNHLFLKDTFDYFLLTEASVTGAVTTVIDGRLHPDFYSSEELSLLRDSKFADWHSIRPVCFQLIKGNRLPLQFKIVLGMTKKNIEKLLASSGLTLSPDDIGGLFLTFRYEKGALHAVSGTSLKTFVPDRTLDQEWDAMVRRILKHSGIVFEES